MDELGEGGQRLAEKELGWNQGLIRKGKRETESWQMVYRYFLQPKPGVGIVICLELSLMGCSILI